MGSLLDGYILDNRLYTSTVDKAENSSKFPRYCFGAVGLENEYDQSSNRFI